MSNKDQIKERLPSNRDLIFIGEYLISRDPGQAALKAGYSKSMAKTKAYQWVSDSKKNPKPHIRAAVEKALEKITRKLDITAERVLQEIAKIGFSNLNDFVMWGPDGVKLKASEELTPEQAACVAEVTEATTEHGGSIRFKLHDKLSALDKLGKHLKLFTDVSEQTVEIVDESKIDEAEQKAAERLEKLKGKRD